MWIDLSFDNFFIFLFVEDVLVLKVSNVKDR